MRDCAGQEHGLRMIDELNKNQGAAVSLVARTEAKNKTTHCSQSFSRFDLVHHLDDKLAGWLAGWLVFVCGAKLKSQTKASLLAASAGCEIHLVRLRSLSLFEQQPFGPRQVAP